MQSTTMIENKIYTGSLKASDTKRNLIALLSDDTVIDDIHPFADICLQFQLYPILFVYLVIVLGF